MSTRGSTSRLGRSGSGRAAPPARREDAIDGQVVGGTEELAVVDEVRAARGEQGGAARAELVADGAHDGGSRGVGDRLQQQRRSRCAPDGGDLLGRRRHAGDGVCHRVREALHCRPGHVGRGVIGPQARDRAARLRIGTRRHAAGRREVGHEDGPVALGVGAVGHRQQPRQVSAGEDGGRPIEGRRAGGVDHGPGPVLQRSGRHDPDILGSEVGLGGENAAVGARAEDRHSAAGCQRTAADHPRHDVGRADRDRDARRQAQIGRAVAEQRRGVVVGQDLGQQTRGVPNAGLLQERGVPSAATHVEREVRGIRRVGAEAPGKGESDPVFAEHEGRGGFEGLGLLACEPRQGGQGKTAEHHIAGAGEDGAGESGARPLHDEVGGAAVVPQDRRPHELARGGEQPGAAGGAGDAHRPDPRGFEVAHHIADAAVHGVEHAVRVGLRPARAGRGHARTPARHGDVLRGARIEDRRFRG